MAFPRKKEFLIVLALIVAAYLAGFLPGYFERSNLQRDLSQVREEVRVLSLQGELGMILLEVEQANFGRARERSTRFFNEIRDARAELGNESLRQVLADILDSRDAVNSDLTSLNPEVAKKLRTIYQKLHGALAGP